MQAVKDWNKPTKKFHSDLLFNRSQYLRLVRGLVLF